MEGFYYHRRCYRTEVRRDVTAVSPVHLGFDAASWRYQQWVKGEVYVVKIQRLEVDTPHDDPTHAVKAHWDTFVTVRNVYLTRGNDTVEPFLPHDVFDTFVNEE